MNRYSGYTDDQLLPLLTNGDSESFREIFKRYSDKMYRFIHSRVGDRDLCEDMVQDTFTTLWDKREQLHIQSLNAYLYRTAKNEILMHIRSGKIHERYEKEFINLMIGQHDTSIDEALRMSDLHTTIEKSISQLPEHYQTAFRLSRYENRSITEIAERMNLSKRTVENYITHALKHLRSTLGELLFLLVWMGIKD